MRDGDVPDWLTGFVPVCEALAALLHPHGEVAVHDLATDRVVAIWNPLSGRAPGDASLLDDLPEAPGNWTAVGPYAKVLPDGRRLSSVSAVLADTAGRRRGLLCVNLDRSPLEEIAALAGSLVAPRVDRPRELFERDWRERIPLRAHELMRERGERRGALSRDCRREIVAQLDAEGLFEVRHAAEAAAEALGVSRATVYSVLKEVRS